MKYLVDWWDHKECGEKIFKDRYEAEDYRYKMIDKGRHAKVYPIVRCCKQDLICANFTNTCEVCGADYNFNGERLCWCGYLWILRKRGRGQKICRRTRFWLC